jgi:hypothetical protein
VVIPLKTGDREQVFRFSGFSGFSGFQVSGTTPVHGQMARGIWETAKHANDRISLDSGHPGIAHATRIENIMNKLCLSARSLRLFVFLLIATIAIGKAGAQQVRVPHAQAVVRAKQIVAQMTLDEKIAQLHGIRDAENYRVVPGLPSLGVPAFHMTNGPAGVGPGGAGPQKPATAMPAPIALAATWDPELARQYGRLEAEETPERCRVLDFLITWAS